MYMHVGIVDSFQEVDLGVPGFSDVGINGKDSEASSSMSIKSEVSEEQSEAKANDKSLAAVSLELNNIIKCCSAVVRTFPCRCHCH